MSAMIAFLRGVVAEALPQRIVLDVHGVGYEVLVPLSTFDALNPLPGKELTLKTYLHIRENMQVLYGFATDAEKDIFMLLIDRVSGIGPTTAMAILGSMNVDQFKASVVNSDARLIAKAKGVGKKTAERIILELKDKVGLGATWEAQASGSTSQAAGDAELALIALGFKQTDTRKVLAAYLKDHPEADTDELIRAALRSMN
jgi:Holliday junction DNA helicase RuvA